MAKEYTLLKLPIKTVRELKKRQKQRGKPSLNELIKDMIRCFDDRNDSLQRTGWLDEGCMING